MRILRASARFLPIGLALLCVQLDFFSLNLAMPTIARSLGLPVTDLQWIVSAYLLGLGAMTVPAGRLGDILGRKRVIIVGLVLFAITSAICGASTELAPLVISRAVQGVGAALIMPNAFALVTNDTTEQERPGVVGAMIGFAGIGTAVGPVVGGVLAASVGWPWVFWLNVPMAVIAVIGTLRLPESRNEELGRSLRGLDWWGVLTVAAGLTLASLGIDDVNTFGWGSWLSTGLLVLGVLILGVFVFIEVRVAANPLIHPELVRNRPFVALLIVGTIGNIGVNVFLVMATFELQSVRGFDPQLTGLLFISASAGIALSGPVGGWACSRWPAPRVLSVGTMIGACSVVMLAISGFLPLYLGALFVCGVTCGMAYSVAQIGVQSAVPQHQAGEATSFLLMPLVAVGGLSVVVTSGIVEAIGDGKPTDAGIDAVLIGTAVAMGAAGLLLLIAERTGVLKNPAAAAA